MNVRAQVSMVFHLDKCIGCHTCSLACKNLWTNRRGAEYMWWNNVETKPGTGYPSAYEDQAQYRGGWERRDGEVRLRLGSRLGELASLFFNARLPVLDDYYEPWTYHYEDLLEAERGDDQPVATPVSQVTGRPIEIAAGPNWDDDLGGSNIYAAHDPNLDAVEEARRRELFQLDRLAFFYLPRICNHCLNPGCAGACPAGAIYKRGEDGIVLVGQDKCRGWRMCVSGCPYKKSYYNWSTGKAEKCILCYPRQETQQVPACMHTCVGRIRYLGMLLYDADGIPEAVSHADGDLVEAQRRIILDPFDREVCRLAHENGVHEKTLDAARRSPVYQFVKVWQIALPHHPDFRTLPMLFYVPPLLPVAATMRDGCYDLAPDLLTSLESARLPLDYFSRLLAGGNQEIVIGVLRKLIAGRLHLRAKTVGDVPEAAARQAMELAGAGEQELEATYRLTSLADFHQRFVVPPFFCEEAIESRIDPQAQQEQRGVGFVRPAERGL
jgi:nitrate reductase beta subunit